MLLKVALSTQNLITTIFSNIHGKYKVEMEFKRQVYYKKKRQRIPKGQYKIDPPEKPVTQGTQDEERHNTVCIGHHYTRTNTNNINKTRVLLQTIGGKEEPNKHK